MAENGQKISLPTPVLGMLVGLFIWLAGGTLAGVWLVATIATNVSNLSSAMLQQQIRADADQKTAQARFDSQQSGIVELRERIIKLEESRRKEGRQ